MDLYGVRRMGVNCVGVVKDCVCGLCGCEVTGDMDFAGVGMGVWICVGVGRMGVNCVGAVKDCVCGLCGLWGDRSYGLYGCRDGGVDLCGFGENGC